LKFSGSFPVATLEDHAKETYIPLKKNCCTSFKNARIKHTRITYKHVPTQLLKFGNVSRQQKNSYATKTIFSEKETWDLPLFDSRVPIIFVRCSRDIFEILDKTKGVVVSEIFGC
jgi:hypothetical protein